MNHPPREIAGNKAVERKLNELRRYVMAIRPLKGKGIRISQTANGSIIASEAEGGGEGTPLWG